MGGCWRKFEFCVDGCGLIGRMRTSPAVPGVSAVREVKRNERNFQKTLDEMRRSLHNLASLLKTKRKRRRGGIDDL